MQMSENEIRRSYRESKSKRKQITILAELNCCTTDEIKKIIAGDKQPRKEPKVKNARVIKEPEPPKVSRRIADELVEHLEAIEERRNALLKERHELEISINECNSVYEEYLEFIKKIKVEMEVEDGEDGKNRNV